MKNDYQHKEADYFTLSRTDLNDHIPQNLDTVLDVGCSNGNFSLMLKNKFGVKEAWGIEPFAESAEAAAQVLDRAFHAGIEEAIPLLENKKFDCIFFNDVLEHLIDPYTVLSSVKKNLHAGGTVFASIPNVLQLETIYKILRTRNWQYEKHGIMDATHLRFFSRKSMIDMFQQAGYKVEKVIGINPKITPKFKLFRLLMGKFSNDFKFVQFIIIAKRLTDE